MTLRLLTEHENGAGRIYLRAGAEAINVLIDRLDVDAASEAQAAELRLRFLIENRQMHAAQSVAHAMRLLSVQFMEQTRRYIDAAERNLDELDWLAAVAPHLRSAHEHLVERLAGERAIIGEIQDMLISGESRERQAALEAVQLLRATQRAHADLLSHLAGVHAVFTKAQDRQQFRARVPSVRLADLRKDVLTGFMSLKLDDAHRLAPHPIEVLLGAVVPPAMMISDIVDRGLSAERRDDTGAGGVTEPELVDDVPDDVLRERLLTHLDPAATDGRLLSELLCTALPELDDRSLWCLATIAAESFGGEHLAVLGGADLGDEHASVPTQFLAAYRTGKPLEVPGAAWLGGDDLRLLVLDVVEEDADA
jgi:hypothetical protein